MSTRLLKFQKNGQTVQLSEPAHIDAYKAKGWIQVFEDPALQSESREKDPALQDKAKKEKEA